MHEMLILLTYCIISKKPSAILRDTGDMAHCCSSIIQPSHPVILTDRYNPNMKCSVYFVKFICLVFIARFNDFYGIAHAVTNFS